MNALKLEEFLAQIYTDESLCCRFLANPRREAVAAGLTAEECAALENIDRVGLGLASASFARKRGLQPQKNRRSKMAAWFRRFCIGNKHRACLLRTMVTYSDASYVGEARRRE